MSLYRTYRPQSLEEVTGQVHVVTPVRRQIETDTVAHAYLFSGPRGVGKTTIARLIARALNCEKPKGSEPCKACDACKAIEAGSAMDVIEIDAASHTGVDNVRDNIIENVRFAPNALKKKVFIIDEVHMLSKGAFNALLKTLEEPPEYAIFVLATTEIHKIPDTIISRCQRFDFTKISVEEIAAKLKWIAKEEGVDVDESVLFEVARRAGGCMRDAESLLGQVIALGDKKITAEMAQIVMPVVDLANVVELVASIVRNDAKSAVQLINKTVAGGAEVKRLLDEMISLLRHIMLYRVDPDITSEIYSKEQITQAAAAFEDADLNRMRTILDRVLEARTHLAAYAIPQLALELAVVDLCAETVIDPPVSKPGEVERVIEQTPPPGSSEPVEPQKKEAPGAKKVEDNVTEAVVEEPTTDDAPVHVEAEASEEAASEPDSVDLEGVKKYWSMFQKEVRKRHASLPLALELADPLRVDGNIVMIKVQFEFYAETVNQAKNSQFLSEVLSEVVGKKLGLQAVYENVNSAPEVTSVIEAFGGEVVG